MTTKESKSKVYLASFGRHVRSLRKARGLTRESLAEASGQSSDTIRRLEHGEFSASLDTLRKVASGLDMQLSTLFTEYDLNERATHDELIDMLAGRSARETEFGLELLRSAYAGLDAVKDDDDGEHDDDTD